jgi:hypothetical protein
MYRYRSTRDFMARSRFLLLVGPVVTIAFALIGWWVRYWWLTTGLWLACLALRVALRHMGRSPGTPAEPAN